MQNFDLCRHEKSWHLGTFISGKSNDVSVFFTTDSIGSSQLKNQIQKIQPIGKKILLLKFCMLSWYRIRLQCHIGQPSVEPNPQNTGRQSSKNRDNIQQTGLSTHSSACSAIRKARPLVKLSYFPSQCILAPLIPTGILL